MRKLILFMVYSLDGYVAGPNNELNWEIQDPEVGRYLIPELLKTVDSVVLGRVLYEGFQQFWPAAAKDASNPKDLIEFAEWLGHAPKFVFSKTLKKVEWENSELFSPQNDADFIKAVAELKERPGGDIVVFGGVRIVQTLVRLGLIDEYRFKVQPVILGKGKSIFEGVEQMRKLKLIKSKAFDCGVVASYYIPIQ